MKLEFRCTDCAPIDWDSWNFANTDWPQFYQSAKWADLLFETEGSRPIFIRILFNGRIVGQALVAKKFYYNRSTGRKIMPLPYFECLRGPNFVADIPTHIARSTYAFILHMSRKSLGTHLMIVPNYLVQSNSNYALFNDLKFNFSRWGTYALSLETSAEATFKKFSCKVRNTIRKAQKKGVVVKKISSWDEYCNVYIPQLNLIKERTKLNLCKAYGNDWFDTGRDGNHYYLAEKDGVSLACLGVQIYGSIAYTFGYGTSSEAMKEGIPAQDLLHWAGMEEAIRSGADLFDFAGVNPVPTTPKEKGILFFKKKWGGEFYPYPVAVKEFIPCKSTVSKIVKKIILSRRNI